MNHWGKNDRSHGYRNLNDSASTTEKVDKVLVVSGTNQGFWSHLGCSRRNITILAVKVSFRVH